MLTITERGMLKFPTLIIAFSVLPFSSVSFYFMYSEALLLDGCTFGIVMPSQYIDFFLFIKFPFNPW